MRVLGSRERAQAPPPHIVFDDLCRPNADPYRKPWLRLLGDEVPPTVLAAHRPDLVVWSSLWPSRPDDRVRFELRPDGTGCRLRWTLLTPDDADEPDASKLGHLRRRMNLLVNGRLRAIYGQ